MKNKKQNKKTIFLLNPRGFCSGVKRAIATVNKALKIYSGPIYVFHDIVHNERVVDDFKKKGVIFINNLNSISPNSILIISAHGTSPNIKKEAAAKKLILIDATCPLVNKIHNEARKYKRENYNIILVGKKNHHEVNGIMGECQIFLISKPDDINKLKFAKNDKIACLTQTTFLKSDRDKIFKLLKLKYKKIIMPNVDDICPATYRRREAIIRLNKKINLLLVIGSKKSNNAKRLLDIAVQAGIKSCLISSSKKINNTFLKNCEYIGITAAASTPEDEVSLIVEKIKKLLPDIKIREIGVKKIEPVFSLFF